MQSRSETAHARDGAARRPHARSDRNPRPSILDTHPRFLFLRFLCPFFILWAVAGDELKDGLDAGEARRGLSLAGVGSY